MRRKPVIGNRNCASVAGLIRPGENGLLASTRQELQDHLVDLLTHPDRAASLGQAGQEMVLRKHTWRAIARRVLDHLESAHFDCFPSGHTELTLLAWWSSRQISTNLFWGFSVYSVSILFATVYLRYHYTVDVFAGAALAAVLLVVAPHVYRLKRLSVG